jgi:4a-hydroxytetrahydrobiopterin dehydratase
MAEAQNPEQLKAERIQSKLKAERIQERLKAERIQSQLKAERIQALLSEVPGWEVGEDGASLTRTYDLPSLRASGLFVQLVLKIGEQTGYVPEIAVRYLEVTLTIATAHNEGLTELDFDVARALDSRL